MHRPPPSIHLKIHGFSLVELSIVLVILGLLVGGILSGQSLIRASELRSIITERDKFTAAMHTFRDKYFALPGDLPNAFQLWGAACGTNDLAPSSGCNGDGNSLIDYANGETAKVWEHLARAGLIEGSFDGTGIDSGARIDASTTNAPKSKFPQGYWDMNFNDENTAGIMPLPMNASLLLLRIGALGSGTVQPGIGFPLTRGDAWNIDTKTDYGRANTGKLRGDAGLDCWDNATDHYNLQGTNGGGNANTTDCMLHFILN